MRKGRMPEKLDWQCESELQTEFEKDAAEDRLMATNSMKMKMSCHCDLFPS